MDKQILYDNIDKIHTTAMGMDKTFTDFTHSLSEIISGMCNNGIVITGLKEFDHDISGGFSSIDHRGYPLSMILQGNKQ